jgi:hypothetical protein
LAQQFPVADVAAHEDVPRIALQRREVLQIAGVGQLVEVDDTFIMLLEPVEHEVCADEAGTSGNKDHIVRSFRYIRNGRL